MTWAMLQHEPLLTLAPLSVFGQLLEVGQLVRLPLVEATPFEPLGLFHPHEPVPAASAPLRDFLGRVTTA